MLTVEMPAVAQSITWYKFTVTCFVGPVTCSVGTVTWWYERWSVVQKARGEFTPGKDGLGVVSVFFGEDPLTVAFSLIKDVESAQLN